MLHVDAYLSKQLSSYFKFKNIITISNPLGLIKEYYENITDADVLNLPVFLNKDMIEIMNDIALYFKITSSVYDVALADTCSIGDLALAEIGVAFIAQNEYKMISTMSNLIDRISNEKRLKEKDKKTAIEYLNERIGRIVQIGCYAMEVTTSFEDVIEVPKFNEYPDN